MRPPPIDPAVNPQRFAFGTKGGTLERLAPLLAVPRLCEQAIVGVRRWRTEPERVAAEVLARFAGRPLAVRSSHRFEDTADSSNAGAFLSLTGVAPRPAAVIAAIDRVIASYRAAADGQEVLIQPMVEDVALAGVVLTRDLDTGGPYYVIDYDDFSGRTDTVTGGAESKTVLVHRTNPGALHSPRIAKIIAMARELEAVTGTEELDIEFCVTSDVQVYLLQVRPLAAQRRWQAVPDAAIDRAIAGIRARLGEIMEPHPDLSGATTILGEMPDWNPAEMIGNTPRRLALTLYKRLITDRTWSEARARMGYRRVDHPLMVDLEGRPYIDVRKSLNSFLPAGLDKAAADRLVDHQLARLAERPDLHDKIEFEIAVTCRDLAFAEEGRRLVAGGLPRDDLAPLEAGLHALTARALAQRGEGLRRLLAETRSLLEPAASEPAAPLGRARRRLDLTVERGTLPFSILARHAFIGVAFLRSLVARRLLAEADAERFMQSVHTVASELVAAMAAVADGSLAEADFLARYGHLRPGTYDILSWRYDEKPQIYLGHTRRAAHRAEPFSLSRRQQAAIARCLDAEGFACDPAGLIDYIAAAVAAREEAKFAFTRGVSDALAAIGEWGEATGFSRDDLSFLDVDSLFRHPDDRGRLADEIARGREAHRLSRALRLPHLIVEPDDIDVVRPLRGRATFITNRTVTAKAVHLETNQVAALDGRVVLIESADPGFDWIFSHDIAGLITQYGGANSHMAIRCAEFGLPAAIGCGERLFGALLAAAVVELNCAARLVKPVGG